jgi:hypothetical protein
VLNLAVAEPSVALPPKTLRDALIQLLDELESLLLNIRTDVYARAPDAAAAPVGHHLARCVARIEGLLAGARTQAIVYPAAAPSLAADPVAALKKVRAIRSAIVAWPDSPLSSVVRVVHGGASPEESDTAWSTLEIELAYVISETIAAQRTIVSMLARAGATVPHRFGTMAAPPLPARSSIPPWWALWRRLDEIGALLMTVPSGIYTARAESGVSGSLGEHVRHCLDHVSTLLAADASTTMSYDRRRRGTTIEHDLAEALQQILRLKAALERWATRSLDEPVRVSSLIDPSGASLAGWSTFGRELAFVLSHTIHHMATMAAVLALHGVAAPAGFGYAPSTPRRD